MPVIHHPWCNGAAMYPALDHTEYQTVSAQLGTSNVCNFKTSDSIPGVSINAETSCAEFSIQMPPRLVDARGRIDADPGSF